MLEKRINRTYGKESKMYDGDVFAIPVSETEFIFGRVLFDVTKQYIKIVPEEEWKFNYLGFFNRVCWLKCSWACILRWKM